jgi:ABC-type transport system involved in multi-copper enzyme maturation permease subunit
MKRILVIAGNTYREAVRDRVLYLLLFFAGSTIILSRLLAVLAVGDRVKIIMDVGLASLSLYGALVAILIGTSLVYREIDKKTIFTLVAKPIHRHEFLLGKFFGLVFTQLVIVLLMTLFFQAFLFIHTLRLDGLVFLAALYIFLELILLTAVAILFSSFSTPILASLFTLSFYVIGHFSRGLLTLIRKMPAGGGRSIMRFFYFLLPDLENFNIKTEVVHHLPIPGDFLVKSAIYGLFYALFILVLTVLVFRRRDFQ